MKSFNFNGFGAFENIALSKNQSSFLRGGNTGGQSGTDGKGAGGETSEGPIPPQ